MGRILVSLLGILALATSAVWAQPSYVQFTNLAAGPTDVSTSWTKIDVGTLEFSTQQTSTIEVHFNSRIRVGSLSGFGVGFQLRLDDILEADFNNEASILAAEELTQFLSIFAVFEDVPAGSHTLSIWGIANGPGASATGVVVDQSNWDGGFVLKVQEATVVAAPELSMALELKQNVPNPFNPRTTVEFELDGQSRVELDVFDAAGRHIRSLADQYFEKGSHTVEWDGLDDRGRRVRSGTYYYQVQANGSVVSKKMTLLK